jgi:DNA-directed RNA polymerase subunit RPC12/RpoP
MDTETTPDAPVPLHLDVSLEKARALHRVWRALNDGDCPRCHKMHSATEISRDTRDPVASILAKVDLGISCPSCGFKITYKEIDAIERLFAPAMNAAVEIFWEWRLSREVKNG